MRVRVHECVGSLLTRVRRCREAERVCNYSTTRKRHHRDGATPPLLPLEPPAKAIMTPQSSAGQHSRYINVSPPPTENSTGSDWPFSGRDNLSEIVFALPLIFSFT